MSKEPSHAIRAIVLETPVNGARRHYNYIIIYPYKI